MKNAFFNSRFIKAILGAFISTVTVLNDGGNLLSLQFIFVGRCITMFVGTIAGAIEQGFSFGKFFRGCFRLGGYWCLCYFGVSLDHTMGNGYIFPFFYFLIILDMVNSFLKHSPTLGIGVSPKIYDFIKKVEEKVTNIFTDKLK